jgi:dipeptidyl-peptidase-3
MSKALRVATWRHTSRLKKLGSEMSKKTVESILGFVEPYRDPFGSRAEFEGLVAVVDEEETKVLSQLVAGSATFVRRLPWVGEYEDGGKGPFERDLFEAPDYTSIHGKLPATCPSFYVLTSCVCSVLACCSSIIFLGINLPNVSIINLSMLKAYNFY